jgi:aspartokinase-like uncharacterized kinase
MPLVIYKLGGSLLALNDWPDRLRRLWSNRPREESKLLVVGGGPATDLVRDWDRRFALSDESAHELALESLRLTERLAAEMLPECRTVRSPADVSRLDGQPGLVSVRDFLDRCETPQHPVPRRWDFTSDAISAWIGLVLHVDELVLLKSTFPDRKLFLDELAAGDFVDREFPRWAEPLPRLTWHDLRSGQHAPILPEPGDI